MRSGTSWLGHLLSESTGAYEVFEPFSTKRQRLQPAILPEDLNSDMGRERLRRTVEAVAQGRVRLSHFSLRGNAPGRYTHRVIKEVHLSWALPWVQRWLPDVPKVIIVRNPFDALKSSLNVLKPGHIHISRRIADFVLRSGLFDAHLSTPERRQILERSHDVPTLKLAHWCVLHRHMLSGEASQDPARVVLRYEALKQDGNKALGPAFKLLRRYGWAPQPLAEASLLRKSRTTRARVEDVYARDPSLRPRMEEVLDTFAMRTLLPNL